MNNIDVMVKGPPCVEGSWTHVVSTFDGTALQLYVNGVLYGDLDVATEAQCQLMRRDAKV